MHEEDETAAEEKNENNRGQCCHNRPEGYVVDEAEKGKDLRELHQKIANFVNHN
jgi:hypothetical protein